MTPHHTGGHGAYARARTVSESSGRYIKRVPGTTNRSGQFRLTKVTLVDLNVAVAECVDAPVTVSVVENEDMSAAQKAQIRPFLAGAGAMVVGAFSAVAAPTLATPWLTDLGLVILAVGALVAAGASERYNRE